MKNLAHALVVSVLTLTPWLASALVSTSDVGRWPETWPMELEPLRKQARTVDVGTGIQQQIHEIGFTKAAEFEKAWPTLLNLKTTNAPITLYWTNTPPPKNWGSLLRNKEAAVRIYSPTYSYTGTSSNDLKSESIEQLVKEGKAFKTGPPWPAEIIGTNGSLPEFVQLTKVNDEWSWIAADADFREAKISRGFFHRARIDLDLVADGNIIDLAKLSIPKGTLVNCEQLPIPELTGEERVALVSEANHAFSNHVKTDPQIRRDEIAERSWGKTMRRLKPIRVVDDAVNIKIVLAEINGIEAGFYVNLLISSRSAGYDDAKGKFVELVHLPCPDDKAAGHIYRYKFLRLQPAARKAE